MNKVKVGVIGCGQISAKYLKNCTERFGTILEIASCADLVPELARKRADEFGIAKVSTVDELLADPEIEIVLNLTIPKAHTEINMRALHAGKHVYAEKPFALTPEEALEPLELARQKGLRVGCAPDTFLGAGLQTCRKLIDEGWIGTPYAASGLILMGNATGSTHPNPHIFLQHGGDSLFDMGPYYITALINMLGPVRRVTGSAQNVISEVKLMNPESARYGETIKVEAPMNVSAVLDFHNGAVATLTAAKEAFGYTPRLEVYGTEGILYCTDPNMFGGTVAVKRIGGVKADVPLAFGFGEESRGLGLTDMAFAIRNNRAHRATGDLAYHVLEVMHGIHESSRQDKHMYTASTCERPTPFPLGLKYNVLD